MNELFVISAQRSGSNWLQSCLSQHANIRINGEIHPSAALHLFDSLKTGDSISYRLLQQKGIFHRLPSHAIKLMIKSNLKDTDTKPIGQHDYIGDKSAYSCIKSLRKHPEQLEYVKLLQKYFPSAKKILLIRDVSDVIVSYSEWGKNRPNALLAFGIRPICLFWRHAHNWCQLHQRWISDMRGDQNCLIIHYKNMKLHFKKTMRIMFQFLELEVTNGFINLLYDQFYSIKSKNYQDENKARGYSFYRRGIVGEWQSAFKWYHRLLIDLVFSKQIEAITNFKSSRL